MAKDSSGLLLLIGGAGVAWWGYTQGWFSSFGLSPAAAPATTGTNPQTPTMPATGGSSAPSTTPAAPSTPAKPKYSGPSLAQMLSALTAAVQAAYGSDSALTCPGQAAPGSQAAAAFELASAQSQLSQVNAQLAQDPTNPGLLAQLAQLSNQVAQYSAQTQAPSSSSCSNPVATKDVFNWYLTNRANVGVTSAPSSNSDQTPVSLSDYWAWAAPQLQAMIPGLSGYGRAYAGLGALVRHAKGW